MGSLALLLVIVGAFLIYEVAKDSGNVQASSSTSSVGGAPTSSSNAGAPTTNLQGPSVLGVPQSWLSALNNSENPAANRGDLSYGTYGITCAAAQSVGWNGPCTGNQQSGAIGGGTFNGAVFSSIDEANNVFGRLIANTGALGATTCRDFYSALNRAGYCDGNMHGTSAMCVSWPDVVCSSIGQ